MDLFARETELFSFDARRRAGFGPGGEKNFEGVITDLMMASYLVVRDFRCRLNSRGAPYGWQVAVYTAPETLWGREMVTAAYGKRPEESRRAVISRILARFPGADEPAVSKALGHGVRRF